MNNLVFLSCCIIGATLLHISTAFAPASISPRVRILSSGVGSVLWNEPTSKEVVVNGISRADDDNKEYYSTSIPKNGDLSLSASNGGGDPSGVTQQPQATKAPEHTEVVSKQPDSFPLVLWRFTRPHTLIGSALAIPSIFLLAAPTYSSFFTLRSLAALVYAAVPMNLYITGLNQITDIDIDKINKPNLPLASGDLKKSTAIGVVLAAVVVSLIMSVCSPVFSTSGLQVALWGSFLLGTVYSLPPFRLKRHPLLAAFCIVAVRGTIINAGELVHCVAGFMLVHVLYSPRILLLYTNQYRILQSCSFCCIQCIKGSWSWSFALSLE